MPLKMSLEDMKKNQEAAFLVLYPITYNNDHNIRMYMSLFLHEYESEWKLSILYDKNHLILSILSQLCYIIYIHTQHQIHKPEECWYERDFLHCPHWVLILRGIYLHFSCNGNTNAFSPFLPGMPRAEINSMTGRRQCLKCRFPPDVRRVDRRAEIFSF